MIAGECDSTVMLKVLFTEFESIMYTFSFQYCADCWRTTEENGHFTTSFIIQMLKNLQVL